MSLYNALTMIILAKAIWVLSALRHFFSSYTVPGQQPEPSCNGKVDDLRRYCSNTPAKAEVRQKLHVLLLKPF